MTDRREHPATANRRASSGNRRAEGQDDRATVALDTDARAAAEREAVARWGTRAIVDEVRTLGADGRAIVVYVVGRQHDAHSWEALGAGDSWRAAFDAAERAEVRR